MGDPVAAGEADPTSPVLPVDAVVVLGGGHGERLARGLELVATTDARVLVLSDGARRKGERRGGDSDGRRLAATAPPYEVLCPIPDPYRTRGEARMVAALARGRRWTRVLVVTSDYHVRRTRLLLARCAPEGCAVEVVGTPSRAGPIWRARATAHELGGLVDAALVHRTC